MGILKEKITFIEEHKKILLEHQADPTFSEFRAPLQTAPDFDDLQNIAGKVFSNRDTLDKFRQKKNRLLEDQKRHKAVFEAVKNEYENIKTQQEDFTQTFAVVDSLKDFSRNQQGQILDQQLKQLKYSNLLAQAKLEVDDSQLFLIGTKMFIKKKHIEIALDEYAHVKRTVSIDSSYVEKVKAELKKRQERFFKSRDNNQKHIAAQSRILDNQEKALKQAVKKYGIATADVPDWWKKDPTTLKILQDWRAVSALGVRVTSRDLQRTKIALLKAIINKAKIDFNHQDKLFEILSSWYKILQKKFRLGIGDKEINEEVNKYKTNRSQLNMALTELKEKRDEAITLLCGLNIERESITNLRNFISKNIPKASLVNYKTIFNELNVARGLVSQQNNGTGKLLDKYVKSIATIETTISKVDDIIFELTTKSFWFRSDRSIEWRNLKKIIPDIERFSHDIRVEFKRYISPINISSLMGGIKDYTQSPYLFILFILRLIMAIVLFMILRSYIPDIYSYLMRGEVKSTIFSSLKLLAAVFVGFFGYYLISIYFWLLLFLVVYLGYASRIVSALFYLLSIPYLLFLGYKFVQRLMEENRSRKHRFIGEHYQKRFSWIFSLLFYVPTIILLFRQAFLSFSYYQSQLPEILFALNFLLTLMLVALLFAVGKGWILERIFTQKTAFNKWLSGYARKYYFLFLFLFIAVTVMSSPYVGYGKQVFYVLSRLIMTVLLIPIFSWLHKRVKEASSDFFFYYSDPNTIEERFSAGKTWYGLFVIFSFVCFLLLATIIITKIWGQSIAWHDIYRRFNYTLYPAGIDEITGKRINITLISLFKVVVYVASGFVVAYITNRYIFKRIFDQLLVSSGVQSTILTLSKYVLIVMAFLIGLQSVGLDAMIMKIIVVVGVIGFAIKEPIGDFFSYFIILVQRPVKIGDLIEIEPDIYGVVRNITPRSTIIRHKNSVTLVVPNSRIITSTIKNWNHAHTFGAFGDILVTVPYSSDPDKVRDIFVKLLEDDTNILKNPKPIVRLLDFIDNGYQFQIRGFLSVNKIGDQFDIASNVRFELVRRLRQEGISVALPTRILKLNNDEKSAASLIKKITKKESKE